MRDVLQAFASKFLEGGEDFDGGFGECRAGEGEAGEGLVGR